MLISSHVGVIAENGKVIDLYLPDPDKSDEALIRHVSLEESVDSKFIVVLLCICLEEFSSC